jgi:NADPH2:quinone reductase
VTGGDLWNVLTSREERLRRAAELFAWVRSGVLRADVSAVFPLARGADAHRLLESRTSTGKILLRP